MILSMTGYGRAVGGTNEMTVTAELKSVNHRFVEVSVKLPRNYTYLEEKIKVYLQKYVSRGKLDCFIQIDAPARDEGVVTVNHALAAGYYQAAQELCDRYGLQMPQDVTLLTSHADIFTVSREPTDEEAVWHTVEGVLAGAVSNLLEMRAAEGARLMEDVLARGEAILGHVAFIEEQSPRTVAAYYEKMKARMRELLGGASVDEQRLLTEAAVFADKVAVAEETVRLRSHIDQLRAFFKKGEPVGKKLDFLVQELNREANTIGSKASDIEITRRVIEIKAEIEKIREQIQNIE